MHQNLFLEENTHTVGQGDTVSAARNFIMATQSITPCLGTEQQSSAGARRNVHAPGQHVTANPAALQRARALRLSSTTDSPELEVPPRMSFQPPGHKSPPLSPHGEPSQQEFSQQEFSPQETESWKPTRQPLAQAGDADAERVRQLEARVRELEGLTKPVLGTTPVLSAGGPTKRSEPPPESRRESRPSQVQRATLLERQGGEEAIEAGLEVGRASGNGGGDEVDLYPGLEGLSMRPACQAVRGPSGWIYHSTSIFCMRPHHFPRNLTIHIVESSWFEPLIALTILCNVTTMAINSPLDPEGTEKAALISKCEIVYLAIFSFELVTKVIAYGFLMHEHSYLRDAWCVTALGGDCR